MINCTKSFKPARVKDMYSDKFLKTKSVGSDNRRPVDLALQQVSTFSDHRISLIEIWQHICYDIIFGIRLMAKYHAMQFSNECEIVSYVANMGSIITFPAQTKAVRKRKLPS